LEGLPIELKGRVIQLKGFQIQLNDQLVKRKGIEFQELTHQSQKKQTFFVNNSARVNLPATVTNSPAFQSDPV
jgi:hypothetical protein